VLYFLKDDYLSPPSALSCGLLSLHGTVLHRGHIKNELIFKVPDIEKFSFKGFDKHRGHLLCYGV